MRVIYETDLLILLVIVIIITALTATSSELCAKFNRHLLQHQCVLTPLGSEGPVYLPNQFVRRNIREDRDGVPLRLRFVITDSTQCEPLPNVVVEVWHADALGYYSSYLGRDPNVPSNTTTHVQPTDASTFLRGTQITDSNGAVVFDTIFPGYYAGRAPHIHVMARIADQRLYTGQFYFHDYLIERVVKYEPYAKRDKRRVKTTDDWIYKRDRGYDTTLWAKPLRGNNYKIGLKADMIIGLNPSEVILSERLKYNYYYNYYP